MCRRLSEGAGASRIDDEVSERISARRNTFSAVVPASEPGPIIRGGHCTKATGRLPERDGAAYGPRLGGRGDEALLLARTAWFLEPIQQNCLTGKSPQKVCPASLRKIFLLSAYPNHRHIRRIPSHSEGRFANVTDAGWDVVDAAASGVIGIAGRV